jgi:RNA polymerase sigma factor (sigma-70 family)
VVAVRLASKDRSLDESALRAIRLGFAGKLRRHQLSEAFIERYADDLVGQGLAEYMRARSQGQQIANPGGWVVNTAFRRALDQLRREGREVYGEGAEAVLEFTGDPAASTEAEAIENVQAERLHEAISTLSVSQRQALSLYFFEEKSTRSAADALGVSEPTFRRRRDSALGVLRERFGIQPPESGDAIAIEVGLAAWLSLATARASTPVLLDRLLAGADWLRHGAAALAARAREVAVRILSSGGGEGVGGAAGGSVAKVVGVCATVSVAACAATGVIGPGIGGVDLIGQGGHPHAHPQERVTAPAAHPQAATSQPKPQTPATTIAPSRSRQHPDRHGSAGASPATASHRAEQKASSQFGVESSSSPSEASGESSSPPPVSAESGATPAPESEVAPSPTHAANEQFGLP